MAIQRITYSEKYHRATLHHWGCNFECVGCSYLLKEPPRPAKRPSYEQVCEAMRGLTDCQAVHFMGGEPTLNPQLPDLLAFCKRKLGLITKIGHSNGWNLITENLDGTNICLKAFSDEKHQEYTGLPKQRVYDTFRGSFEAGLEMKASSVFIPGFIDLDELEPILGFIASLDPTIPFHLMGFIPVPGAPYRRPTDEEMVAAVDLCRSVLTTVSYSHLTSEQLLNTEARDDRFVVRQVL
jgi:pyruvate formate lyase activating enzyme